MSVRVMAGIVLAAGRSSRLGRPKALLEIDGIPILQRLIDVYLSAGLSTVAVVSDRTSTVVPPGAQTVEGAVGGTMIDSLVRGIDALEDDVAGAIVQPVDAPFTSVAMIERLLTGADERPRALVHAGRAGHPVYVPATCFEAVRARPEGGLRTVIEDSMESIEWNTPEILADIDTPSDVERWL